MEKISKKAESEKYTAVIGEDGKIKYVKKKKKMLAFDWVNYVLFGLFGFLCIYPVIYIVLMSFASRGDYLNSGIFVFPWHFNLESYKSIIFQDRIFKAFGISALLVVAGTLYRLLLTCFGGYVFTRKDLPGLRVIFWMILFTMFFNGGLIPFYFICKQIFGDDNLFVLILPFGCNTFNMIIMRNFFSQVPESILESCRLDGASEFTILFRFVMPLSKAGIATIMLWYIVGIWDDWYWPMIFITKRTDLYPLALELRSILTKSQTEGIEVGGDVDWTQIFSQGREAAMICISLVPILAIYPFLQKYFTKGVMIGGVKS